MTTTGAYFLGIWLLYSASMNGMAWYFAHQICLENENLSALPQPLPDAAIAELAGPRIEKFGFSFQTPWKDNAKTRDTKNLAMVNFASGTGIIVFDPAAQIDKIKIYRQAATANGTDLITLIDAQSLNSNYDFMRSYLYASPSQVKWWASRRLNAQSLILLTNKSMDLGKHTKIYDLICGSIRGFQFGDPRSDKNVQLELFDPSDHHYEIIISRGDANSSALSQPEINAIVVSIHPISPPSSAAKFNGE